MTPQLDVHTDLDRPLVGRNAIKRVPIGEADDLIFTFEDEPFVSGTSGADTGGHLPHTRDFDFPTDRRVLDVGAIYGNAGGRIRCGGLADTAADHIHASSLPAGTQGTGSRPSIALWVKVFRAKE